MKKNRQKARLNPFLKQLKKHRDAIAKERDGLRELRDEIDSLLGTGQALDLLDDAIETISQVA